MLDSPLLQNSRFRLIRKVGEGGMGVVYEAFDSTRRLTVALKTLRSRNSLRLQRFKREFRSVADLSHPNIVTLYELFSEGDDWFFTMELVDGTDILEYVAPTHGAFADVSADDTATRSAVMGSLEVTNPVTLVTSNSPLDGSNPRAGPPGYNEQRLRDSMAQLAGALVALHRTGLVHRDLKPANVWVRPGGGVVLMDFGVVSDSDEGEDRVVGTPSYVAPEQARGEQASPAADWYSFGTILFRAMTGRLPYTGGSRAVLAAKQQREAPSPVQLVRDLPDDLVRLTEQLLRRSPPERPSGEEVLAALGGAGEHAFDLRADPSGAWFVGRDAELGRLHDAYGAACDGTPTATFLVGPSGMGKSTLLSRFASELSALSRPPLILRGRCHELESVPFKAFDGLMESLVRNARGSAGARRGIRPADLGPLARLFPVLGEFTGADEDEPAAAAPEMLLPRAVAALRALFSSLAAERPLVLIIDDLHWTDEDSAALLLELVRKQPLHFLLIMSVRVENFDDGDPAADLFRDLGAHVETKRIDLGPMSNTERRLLMEEMLGEAVPETIDAHYAAESAGSPLLLAELARYVQQSGGSAPEALPQLQEMLGLRIERLSEEAKALLEIIGIIGEPVPLHIAAQAAQLSPAAREHSAAVLRNGRLIRVATRGDSPWVTPYHDRIRETVAQQTPLPRQRELHRRIAEQLERWDEATDDALAEHWRAAGEADHAFGYLLSAARAAEHKLAFRRAAKLFGAALQLGRHEAAEAHRLHAAHARALALSGCYAEAAGAYRDASQCAPDSDAIEWTRLSGDNFLRSGQVIEGMRALRVAMDHIGHPLPESRTGLLLALVWERVRVTLRGLRFRAREEHTIDPLELSRLDSLYAAATGLGLTDTLRGAYLQARHVRQALRLGEPKRVCRALAIEAIFRTLTGYSYERATRFARSVVQRAYELNDPFLIGMANTGLFQANLLCGRMREAIEPIEVAIAMLERCVSTEWEQLMAQFFWGYAAIYVGDPDGAAAKSAEFLDDPRRRTDRLARGLLQTLPAVWRCLLDDRPERAHAALDAAMAGWPSDEFFQVHYLEQLGRLLVLQYEGRNQEALALIDQKAARLRRSRLMQLPGYRLEYNIYVARVALAAGDRRRVRRALRTTRRVHFPVSDAVTAAIEAALQAERDPRRAASLYLDAMRCCERIGYRLLAEPFRYRFGELVGGPFGAELCQTALAWFESRGARQPLRFIETLAPKLAGPDQRSA